MTLRDFTGRVVVITGGASGIGRALGERFAAEGSKVVLADVEAAALESTVKELASLGSVVGVRTDVTDPASVEALAAEAYRLYGAVHVLVNNAGVGAPSARTWDTTPNDWRWVHSVNVFGVAHGVQSFVPRMLASDEPAHIVNTSSGDGAINPLASASVYAASKAAVSTLTECLATQLREETGGRVAASLFLPGGGLLDTGLWTADRNRPDELARERPRATPSVTVAQLVEMSAARGVDLPVQPLDALARQVLDGIRDGVYCIAADVTEAAATLRRRADLLAEGRCPTIVEDHGILT